MILKPLLTPKTTCKRSSQTIRVPTRRLLVLRCLLSLAYGAGGSLGAGAVPGEAGGVLPGSGMLFYSVLIGFCKALKGPVRDFGKMLLISQSS